MSKLDYHSALEKLRNSSGNLRCSEVKIILTALGFKVRNGKKGGHKMYSHPSLNDFYGSSYNCGHGKDPQVKKGYISIIIEILERFKEPLEKVTK